jgi:hypothetical protein
MNNGTKKGHFVNRFLPKYVNLTDIKSYSKKDMYVQIYIPSISFIYIFA